MRKVSDLTWAILVELFILSAGGWTVKFVFGLGFICWFEGDTELCLRFVCCVESCAFILFLSFKTVVGERGLVDPKVIEIIYVRIFNKVEKTVKLI